MGDKPRQSFMHGGISFYITVITSRLGQITVITNGLKLLKMK
jgi:hypothetical protein